jgi:hypothetical protein
MFLNKAHKLDPSNPEVLQLIKAVFDQLRMISNFAINDSNDVLRNARNMFKGYMSTKWIQECDNLLNSEIKITSQELQTIPSLYQSEPYSKQQLQIMGDISIKTLDSMLDGRIPVDVDGLNLVGLTLFVGGRLASDTKIKMNSYNLSESAFKWAMSLLLSRMKANLATLEDVDKSQIITTNLIALYDEMNKFGMQKDSSQWISISESIPAVKEYLLKERKQGKTRIKYYSADGKPIYE